jgi:hypothetical protein
MSSQLFPEVLDDTTLGGRFAQSLYLPVGVEGHSKLTGADAVVGTVYSVARTSEADELFGATSTLGELVKFLLTQGVNPVLAVASVKHDSTAPTLVERQTAWSYLESDERVRVRLTDSVTQADHVALASSCHNASLIQNKQIAVVGMAAATSKSALGTAATALAGATGSGPTRAVLVGPGINVNGVVVSGAYAAAAVGAEVAKNSDISNDLDLWPLPNVAAIETAANGQPLFRKQVVAGSVVNDFEDLLQDGISPIMNMFPTGVAITHLRTVYVADTTFDALSTRLIQDQVFVDLRRELTNRGFLRRGNTETVRDLIRAQTEAILRDRQDWVSPVDQPDGTKGYNVDVQPTNDQRQVIVSYGGEIVRGIQTIKINGNLTIAA